MKHHQSKYCSYSAMLNLVPYLSLVCCLVIGFESLIVQAAGDDIQASSAIKRPEFPPIWQADKPDYYHIVADVQLHDARVAYTLEEWASVDLASFRLDLIESESGRKTSILVDGKRQEWFQYEPFTCTTLSRASNLTGALASWSQLDRFFPHDHEFLIAGIGSIWSRASAPKAKQTFSKAIPAAPPGEFQRRSQNSVLLNYDLFYIDADARFPYESQFYFPTGALNASSPSSWDSEESEALALISLLDATSKAVKLRLRIIDFWHTNQPDYNVDTIQESIFDLPAGYGCTRVAISNEQRYSPPNNCFNYEQPRAFQLEASILVPSNLEHDFDKWAHYSSSIRLVAGRLLGREYLAIKRQDYVRTTGAKNDNFGLRLRREKQVWDLGERGRGRPPGGDDDGGDEVPMFYKIDEQLGRCLNQGQAQLNQVGQVEFSILLYQGQHLASAGLPLDQATLERLFVETSGFHSVRESKKYWLKSRKVIEEKRDPAFQLRDIAGNLVWSGPASIVREFSVQDWAYSSGKLATSHEEQQVVVGLHLYSSDLRQLIGRIQLTMSPGQLLDVAQLHRELNIGPCLTIGHDDNWRLKRPHAGALNFKLEYPLELGANESSAEEFNELARGGDFVELIYEKYLEALGKLSGGHLDLLQLEEIEIDFEQRNLVTISGRIFEWPHLFSFKQNKGLQFAPSSRRNLLICELKENEAKCAETCAHYACRAFSYCRDTQICEIISFASSSAATNQTAAAAADLHYEPNESCSTYRMRLDKQRHPISPRELISSQRRAIKANQGDDCAENPLILEFNIAKPAATAAEAESNAELIKLRLIPGSIETDEQQVDLLGLGNEKEAVIDKKSISIQPEFQIVLLNKKFKQPTKLSEQFPLHQANHMSYQDCESLCEQHDCRSFSHCQLDRVCLISKLHRSEEIDNYAESNDNGLCRLMARNYLSKFQKITTQSGVQPPSKRSDPADKSLKLASSRDCAIQCMEEPEFKCRSFLFCSATGDCLLRQSRAYKKWIYTKVTPVASGKFDRQLEYRHQSSEQAIERTCDLFLRSYLTEFEQFNGKLLDHRPTSEPRVGAKRVEIVVTSSVGAETCASKCVDQLEESSVTRQCKAFFVCQAARPICGLLTEPAGVVVPVASGNDGDDNSSNETATTCWGCQVSLVDGPQCTTFIAADQAHLYDSIGWQDEAHNHNRRLLAAEAAGDVDELELGVDNRGESGGGADASPGPASGGGGGGGSNSSWLVHLLMVCIGLLVGCSIGWLLAAR